MIKKLTPALLLTLILLARISAPASAMEHQPPQTPPPTPAEVQVKECEINFEEENKELRNELLKIQPEIRCENNDHAKTKEKLFVLARKYVKLTGNKYVNALIDLADTIEPNPTTNSCLFYELCAQV